MAIRHVIPRQMAARRQAWGQAWGQAWAGHGGMHGAGRVARIAGRTDRMHSTAKAKSGMIKKVFDLSQQNRDGS